MKMTPLELVVTALCLPHTFCNITVRDGEGCAPTLKSLREKMVLSGVYMLLKTCTLSGLFK